MSLKLPGRYTALLGSPHKLCNLFDIHGRVREQTHISLALQPLPQSTSENQMLFSPVERVNNKPLCMVPVSEQARRLRDSAF